MYFLNIQSTSQKEEVNALLRRNLISQALGSCPPPAQESWDEKHLGMPGTRAPPPDSPVRSLFSATWLKPKHQMRGRALPGSKAVRDHRRPDSGSELRMLGGPSVFFQEAWKGSGVAFRWGTTPWLPRSRPQQTEPLLSGPAVCAGSCEVSEICTRSPPPPVSGAFPLQSCLRELFWPSPTAWQAVVAALAPSGQTPPSENAPLSSRVGNARGQAGAWGGWPSGRFPRRQTRAAGARGLCGSACGLVTYLITSKNICRRNKNYPVKLGKIKSCTYVNTG